MNAVREEKKALRNKYKLMRNSIDPEKKRKMDYSLCQKFLNLATYRYADILLLYSPIGSEIDITPIATDAMKKGKRVAYPRCNAADHTMTYHIISDPAQLESGYYGICEPDPSLPLYTGEGNHNAVCMIPALTYDRNGYRIGYGGGYYDRFLSDFHGQRVGVIYSSFIEDSLPHGRYDTSVDFLISEKGVITINAN